MYSFLAMIWDTRDVIANLQADDARRSLSGSTDPRTSVYTAPGIEIFDLSTGVSAPGILPISCNDNPNGGAIFGAVFRSSPDLVPTPPISKLSSTESAALTESGGSSVISQFWGNYLAFVRHSRGVSVIAEPTSSIPCFYTERSGVTFVFSHMEKCRFLISHRWSINYNFILSLLAYDKIQNGSTGFDEIRELLGGERLNVSPGVLFTDQVWDPRPVAHDVLSPSLVEAACQLRRTVEYVVGSWGLAFPNVTVNLSGGLDSSIVLYCLTRVLDNSNLQAVHHILKSDDPVEHHYARAAAEAAGCGLTTITLAPDEIIPDVYSHPQTVRPYRQFRAPDLGARFAGNPELLGTAIFTGQGGDHLFRVRRTPLGFADYIFNNGVNGRWSAELINSARLSGRSVYAVACEALMRLTSRRHKGAMVEAIERNRTIVNSRAHRELDLRKLVPVWASHSAGLPPGKFDQLSALMHLYLIRETLDRPIVQNYVHPLISQPLIELCLRLPIYLLCAHGLNRGLARLAFRDRVPEAIRLRMTKGESTRFIVDQLVRHRDSIKSALADGELVSSGLVTDSSVEEFMKTENLQTDVLGRRAFQYFVVEAWLRTWKAA